MNKQVIVPLDAIDEDDLVELVKRIGFIGQADVKVQRQFVLSSDNEAVMTALGALLGSRLGSCVTANGKHPKNGKKKEPKAAKVATAGMTSHTRRNVENGTIISMQALRKMIIRLPNDGQLENTVWEDIKGQRYVVSGGELIKEPQS